MSLADLIRRKTQSVKVATAIPAIRATPEGEGAASVAGIATIAVADSTERESAYPAPDPLPATHEAAVRAWLDAIGETDPEAIAVVLRQCREDAEARCWYFDPERAGALVLPDPDPQDCRNCTHWRRPGLSDGYCVARHDLPAATALLHELPADNGASCSRFVDWRHAWVGAATAANCDQVPCRDRRSKVEGIESRRDAPRR